MPFQRDHTHCMPLPFRLHHSIHQTRTPAFISTIPLTVLLQSRFRSIIQIRRFAASVPAAERCYYESLFRLVDTQFRSAHDDVEDLRRAGWFNAETEGEGEYQKVWEQLRVMDGLVRKVRRMVCGGGHSDSGMKVP